MPTVSLKGEPQGLWVGSESVGAEWAREGRQTRSLEAAGEVRWGLCLYALTGVVLIHSQALKVDPPRYQTFKNSELSGRQVNETVHK